MIRNLPAQPRELWSRGVTRWVDAAYLLTGSFVRRCLTSGILLRFTPRSSNRTDSFSRIRVREKSSRVRPRKTADPRGEADHAPVIVQGRFRKPLGRRPGHFVLGAQPPTQPCAGMPFDRPG